MFCVTCATYADINDGLIAYYPFNGNANDESGNGNHGNTDGVTLTSDRYGNADRAYEFDGIDDFIEIPHNKMLNPVNFTLVAWIYFSPEYYHDQYRIISKQQNNWHSYGLEIFAPGYFGASGYQLTMHTSTGAAWYNLTLSQELSINQWHCIIGTYDGSEMRLFFNGVLVGSKLQDNGQTDENTSPLIFGKATGAGGPYYFKGIIDDVRIYDRILSVTEIKEIFGDMTCALFDSNKDGVIDQLDQCPDTPYGSIVYSDGCPAIKGDFTDNKKLGLEDCIGILQTLSGTR